MKDPTCSTISAVWVPSLNDSERGAAATQTMAASCAYGGIAVQYGGDAALRLRRIARDRAAVAELGVALVVGHLGDLHFDEADQVRDRPVREVGAAGGRAGEAIQHREVRALVEQAVAARRRVQDRVEDVLVHA